MISDIFNNGINLSFDGDNYSESGNELNSQTGGLTKEPDDLLRTKINNSTILNNTFKDFKPVKNSEVKVSDTLPNNTENDIQKVIAECLISTKKTKELKIDPFFTNEELEILERKIPLPPPSPPPPPPPPPPSPQLLLTINENGSVLNLIIGYSTKSQVVSALKKFSNVSYESYDINNVFHYSDISVRIFFDIKNIVQEIQFGRNYPGKTRKGLAIGDSLEYALKIYSQPKIKSSQTAIWHNNFAVFLENDIITCIRIFK